MSSIFTLGVIPARGGSKTIPRKNLYPLNGIPLIAYTIKAAQGSKLDDFIVTTDDDEIAAYSESLGAKVIRRPAELAQDDTPMGPVVQHAVAAYEWGGEWVDVVCLLQPTSPLRTPEDIDGALAMYMKYPYCDVVSVTDGVHPKKCYDLRGVPFLWGLPPYDKHEDVCLVRNGAIFLTPRRLLNEGKVFSDYPLPYHMPKTRSIDIDDMEDMAIAEALLRQYQWEKARKRMRGWMALPLDERLRIVDKYSRDIAEENAK